MLEKILQLYILHLNTNPGIQIRMRIMIGFGSMQEKHLFMKKFYMQELNHKLLHLQNT